MYCQQLSIPQYKSGGCIGHYEGLEGNIKNPVVDIRSSWIFVRKNYKTLEPYDTMRGRYKHKLWWK
jgi:hypothetical protein